MTDLSDDEYLSMTRPTSSEGRQIHQKREREARELHRFAGLYTLKANSEAFTPGISDRVKNISKISMNPSKTMVKKDDGKPKFVELHQYPGYDPAELTPLPNDIGALDVLSKVADAQPKLRKKIGSAAVLNYRPEFERLFYSQMSQSILLDTFWWYFQEKYQPSKQYQMKLFNRIAHNYVKLLTHAKHQQYRDSFLRDYPSLVAQSVYTAFCMTFPDSYRQYNIEFKEDLVRLVFEWVAGVRPAPNTWQSWNLNMLEPPNIKAREDMMNQAKDKKSSVLNFDFLESSNSQYTGSQSTINHLGTSVSSMSGASIAATGRRQPTGTRRSSHARRSTMTQSSPVFSESVAIAEVAEAQSNEERALQRKRKMLRKKSSKNMMDANKLDPHELLTPIREFQEDETGLKPEAKGSKISTADAKSYISTSQPKPKLKKESHPVGRGPEFVRNVFNIYGQSPLVAHFMRMKHLQDDSGMVVRTQRTEIGSLPAVGTKTYQQLIQDSFKGVRQLEKDYQALVDRDVADSTRFIRHQKAELRDHTRRQKALLSKPREVKRLSDLLILELKKDEDSIGAGASAAVEAALQSVSVE